MHTTLKKYGNLQMRLIKLSKGKCDTQPPFLNTTANFLYDMKGLWIMSSTPIKVNKDNSEHFCH